jgi:uncharacterized protein YbaR (Trm112 family)
MISIQEIHFYNNLVNNNKVKNLIVCPISSSDIVVTRVDEDDRPYFYCISCKTVFRLTDEVKKIITLTIKKFI